MTRQLSIKLKHGLFKSKFTDIYRIFERGVCAQIGYHDFTLAPNGNGRWEGGGGREGGRTEVNRLPK